MAGRDLGLMTWVDNLFGFFQNAAKALEVFRALEKSFEPVWGIRFKPSSLEILCPKGSEDLELHLAPWNPVSAMTILGHLVSYDAGIRDDWNDLRPKMWRAFFGNCSFLKLKHVPLQRKLCLLSCTQQC